MFARLLRPDRRGLRPTATCPAASTTRPRPASRPSRSRRIIAKVADNDDPDFRTRAILIKEQRSELVKHHLWVLWTDYFKPPHFEKYPQLHQLFNEATKLAGATGAKGSLDAEWPTSCSPRSTRSPRSSGRPRRPDRLHLTSPHEDSNERRRRRVGRRRVRPSFALERRRGNNAVGQKHPDVELRIPADSAYLAVLRTATAGLAARLDFTLDDIEDLRIAVDEACAMVLPQAREDSDLTCTFDLDPPGSRSP